MNIKYSFIIGIFNADIEYLEKFFYSVLNCDVLMQSEIIIFNDGSSDKITKYLNEKASKNVNIKLLGDGKNHGLAYGLNRCIEIACGEYLVRADSDDYFDTDRISEETKYLEENNLDIVGCNMHLFDKDGIRGERIYNERIQKKDFLKSSPISHPTVLMKRNIFFDKTNFYSEAKHSVRNEDYELFIRLFSKGYKFGNLQKKLYYFREDINAAGRRNFKSRVNEMIVKYKGFKLLNVRFYFYIYCLRPIILAFIPKKIYMFLRLNFKKSKN